MTDVVVRRRAGLMAFVAIASAALAAGYLWRFSEDGSGVALLVGLVLGVIGVAHGLAWSNARTPLLVADDTGVRIRLGSAWTGIPWSAVERVEIDERGRLTDGHVAVLVPDDSQALADASVRTRLAAALNRQLYDAPLVVPFGLTTIVSVVRVAESLDRLVGGRAEVVVVEESDTDPEPTVEITQASQEAASPDPDPLDAEPLDAEPLGAEPLEGGLADAVHPDNHEDASASGDDDPDAPPEPAPQPRPRRRLFAARDTSSVSARPVISRLIPSPARRAEVTMPTRTQHATMGDLALSEPLADPFTEDLPEIPQMRRMAQADADRGNVSLIIDATTDMSVRAMEKVRWAPATRPVGDATFDPPPRPTDTDNPSTIVGGRLAAARHRLDMSVDELAERTRIRPYVIERIEVDDFSPCGGDFYARGHIRMLARVLGMDPAPIVEAYDETFGTSPVNPRAVFELELATGTTGMVRGGERGANWGALIAAVLVLILVWGLARYFAAGPGPLPEVVQPTENAQGLGSPGAGNRPIPPPREAHVKVTAIGGNSRVVVKDRYRQTVFEGVLSDGISKKFAGEAPLRVMAHDGGLISLSVKGRNLGPMGKPGLRAHDQIRGTPPPSP